MNYLLYYILKIYIRPNEHFNISEELEIDDIFLRKQWIIDQFGRMRCQKKRKDMNELVTSLRVFQKYFVVQYMNSRLSKILQYMHTHGVR